MGERGGGWGVGASFVSIQVDGMASNVDGFMDSSLLPVRLMIHDCGIGPVNGMASFERMFCYHRLIDILS